MDVDKQQIQAKIIKVGVLCSITFVLCVSVFGIHGT